MEASDGDRHSRCGGVAQTLARRWSEAGHQITFGSRDPLEFQLRPGVPHEFETFAHATDFARRAAADRLHVLGAI
jgi:hypothetical protein